MHFDYNEEQRLLAESVRRFVSQEYGFEARRAILDSPGGCSERVWKSLADLGLLGLPIAPEHGGFGGGAVDMMSTMEAIGEALVVEPYLATVGLGARLVALAGSDAQKRSLLPAIVSGELKLALAHLEPGARYELARVASTATRTNGGYTLDGRKSVVLHAPSAGRLLVTARTAGTGNETRGISLFVVDPEAQGLRTSAYRTLDGLRAADLEFRGVRVEADALLGGEGGAYDAIDDAVDFATALLCAEAVGALRSANEATLEYLKTRRQFGVPIGSFQALQHRMVDMAISLEQARSMASLACARVDAGGDAAQRRRVVSAAKFRIAEACRHVSQESVQLHGGMGMSDELKVSHTFRRLTMIAQQFGDADHHLERFQASDASSRTPANGDASSRTPANGDASSRTPASRDASSRTPANAGNGPGSKA